MNLFAEYAAMLVRLVLVSVLCCLLDLSVILDWGKRLIPLVHVKSVLVTERDPSLWYLSRSYESRQILPFLLDSNDIIVRIVSLGLILLDSYSLMMTLFLTVMVRSGSQHLSSSHVADLPLLQQLS